MKKCHVIPHVAMSMMATLAIASSASAQAVTVPLVASTWQATDSIRFEDWQGRSSVYINRGVALFPGANLRNGRFEADMSIGTKTNNIGLVFHARDRDAGEVIFFRPGATGTVQSVQYGPALNGTGAAWQLFHGDGANAIANLPRDQWIHVAVQIKGDTARLFLDHATDATLTVPHLVLGADGGGGIGVWTGAFGVGAHFANVQYTPDSGRYPPSDATLPTGTIVDWDLSPAFDAPTQTPGTLPVLAAITWQKVHAEWPGWVLVNRYRIAPGISAPSQFPDSIMNGRVVGSKVVYARAIINAPAAGLKRLHIGFSDGLVVYCNGVPLYFGMHPFGPNNLGNMEMTGDAVYLPLKQGRNEIVFAVTEFFGGWAFSGRLDQ